MRHAPSPPRALVGTAGVVLAAGIAVMVAGAWTTGVSWDETYHVMRLRNYLDHGWYLLDADLDQGRPGAWVEQTRVYAPVTMLLLHGGSLLLGTDSAGVVSTTATGYAVRHLGVVLVALVGTAATAVLVRLLLRSWGWGLVAAAVLVAVPTWTGHAMFNVKDVPVATGCTLVTLGVAVVARSTAARPWVAAGLATTLAGLVLAVGTRPGIWPTLALAGGIAVLVLLARRARARAAALVVVALAAVGVLVAVYPEAFGNPLTGLVRGALESSSYGDDPGRRWYLPLYLVVELPTLLLVLGAVGAVLTVRLALRRGAVDDRLLLVLVLVQTFTLPLLAVAKASNLYTGIRQLLFAAPGLAVLVTVALAVLGGGSTLRARRLVPALGAVAIVVPLVAQVQLFPYSYAFSSVPANLVGPVLAERDRDLEVQTDYWRTSVRELAPDVPREGWVTCTPRIDDQERFLPRADETRQDCASDPIGPLAPYDATRAAAGGPEASRFLAVDAGSAFVGSNCITLHRVTRVLWWRTVTMSSVSDCDLVLPELPAGGTGFDGAGEGADLLRGAWSILRQDPGIGLAAGDVGLVGFDVPADLAGAGLEVRFTGSDLAGTSATANGVPVPLTATGDRLVLDVPASVAGAWGEDRLVLALTAPASGLRLSSLDVTRSPEVPS